MESPTVSGLNEFARLFNKAGTTFKTADPSADAERELRPALDVSGQGFGSSLVQNQKRLGELTSGSLEKAQENCNREAILEAYTDSGSGTTIQHPLHGVRAVYRHDL